ncbi:hypothetical protein [Fimbriiglobus ruber]|uniref:Uncharacterized protein n=1 Tax=Fimbriiglobus ruber TaxID=1908690 RepID=A0A225DAE5_9BACT|nr:hypothetical protein [Fimbriiglobus ruber]OWK38422.1 hypothetical protein FRUB_07542 [Fimbriiglobus ruber]
MDDEYPNGPDPAWLVWCDKLLKRLVPEDMFSPATSRQGQLLVAASTLFWEVRNAGANWDDKPELFAACEEFVARHLCDGTMGGWVAEFVRGTFAHLHRWMDRETQDYAGLYEAMFRLDGLAYHWCRLHPEPIPPEVVLWEFPATPDAEQGSVLSRGKNA